MTKLVSFDFFEGFPQRMMKRSEYSTEGIGILPMVKMLLSSLVPYAMVLNITSGLD